MDHEASRGAPDWEEGLDLLRRLPSMAVPERMGSVERLVRNPSPALRQQALRMGAALLPNDRLEAWLREEADDVLRNAGLEMLKLKSGGAFDLAVALTRDGDADVVLQAVLLLDHIGDPRAYEVLPPLLHSADPNVVQTALTAMGHLGDARAIPELLPFLSADPWLQMAAVQALGDLRSPRALRALKPLLTDLFLGPLAAEALARIGGRAVFRVLSEHWLAYRDDLDAERFVGLLAHVAQGLARRPKAAPGLLDCLDELLEKGSPSVRQAAATCLLALGPSASDGHALAALAAGDAAAPEVPHVLRARTDLVPALLASPDPLRDWGFQMAGRSPGAVAAGDLARALSPADPPPQSIPHAAEAARRVRGPGLAEALLNLGLSLPADTKSALAPALAAHRPEVLRLLAEGRVADPEEALLLGALAGAPPARTSSALAALPEDGRLRLAAALSEHAEVIRRLPWAEWVGGDPQKYVPVLAEAAARCQWRDALPLLRPTLADAPSPAVVRAVGLLLDRESVPALAALLTHAVPILRACAIEALGHIGGPQARTLLRQAARQTEPRETRLAYMALGRCATEEDAPMFREAASHSDWMVRLSCADALGRSPSPEDLTALMGLAADPVAAVAQKAQAFLEG